MYLDMPSGGLGGYWHASSLNEQVMRVTDALRSFQARDDANPSKRRL